MDSKTELRKISPGNLFQLVQILEQDESWKRLMAIIPKTLAKDHFESIIDTKNPKYRTEHFKLIENAGFKLQKPCTEILFEEWGTSGRIRPCLGHLLWLLGQAKLYRAADNVADLLNVSRLERPIEGPEATIDVNIDVLHENEEVERMLDEIDYPHSILNSLVLQNNMNRMNEQPKLIIPKIVVDDINDSNSNNYKIPTYSSNSSRTSNVSPGTESTLLEQTNSLVSDMMQFSSEIGTSASYAEAHNNYLPNFSDILKTETNVPEPETNELPAFSQILQSENNLPAFSQILSEPTVSIGIPNLSLLQEKPTSTSARTPSPLPNLSLNTVLPHFTYQELELCTGGFDETKLSTSSDDHQLVGRKLGSGAFGSVYLAIGLMEKPVAVKRLNLNGIDVVNEDDTITKQFRNEVEILCKYKHENLLSLLGYSCDGPTYCLIYNYVAGGALDNRLQCIENRLVWTNRLYIALGTARAVSYLHNAYSTPLIHRDIKSANILLDNNDKPKLGDFGLIKLTPNQNANTSTTAYGTSAYMAREAFSGDVSVKLDTFSFGVVLLELLTGLPPIDEMREETDLVTHVESVCEDNDIEPLLDGSAGTWSLNNNDFGQQLYRIAVQCLDEKKKRPFMVDVVAHLSQLMEETK